MSERGVQTPNLIPRYSPSLPSQVSSEEWEAIPDIGDYTIKKQPRMQVCGG